MHENYKSTIKQFVPELSIRSFTYLGEGEDNLAFEVNDDLIFRFTKQDHEALEREVAILRFVRALSPLPVPVPVYDQIGQGFIGYQKLPGVPLIKVMDQVDVRQWPRFATQLADFLSVMNGAEVSPIKNSLEGDAESLDTWRTESQEFFAQVRHVIPQSYHESIQAFLSTSAPEGSFTPVFAHNDLGIEHMLVDPAARQITGIIDWGDAALADPAYDFGKVFRDLGVEVFQAVLHAYKMKSDPSLAKRAAFYARCGVLEDVVYGLERQSDRYIKKCLAALPWLFHEK